MNLQTKVLATISEIVELYLDPETTKKARSNMRTPVPRPIKDEKPVNGEVRTYFLTPEELEKYRNLKPPRDSNGKLLKKAVYVK